jgi:hypothetical protein
MGGPGYEKQAIATVISYPDHKSVTINYRFLYQNLHCSRWRAAGESAKEEATQESEESAAQADGTPLSGDGNIQLVNIAGRSKE